MSKPVLTVILAGRDRAVQREHLARGALFVPVPEPAPEPFAELVVRVEAASGESAELAGRVLQILEGRGIALAFEDLNHARAALAPVFDAPEGGEQTPTLVFWGRTGDSVPPPAEPIEGMPADDRDESAQVRDEIARMSNNEKMQLALKGDRLARFLLLKEPNKALQSFLLQNPRTTIDEVRYIAGYRQANPDALVTIAAHRDWGSNAGVVSALIRNPKTPGPTALKLLDKVPMAEIRRLAKSTDTPRAVQAAARKRVSDAAG